MRLISPAQPSPHLLTTFSADTCVHLAAAQFFRMALSVKTCLILFLIITSYFIASSAPIIPISEIHTPLESMLLGLCTLASEVICMCGIDLRALLVLPF